MLFPPPEEIALHKSLRENKTIADQMDLYNPLLEEVVFAKSSYYSESNVLNEGKRCCVSNYYFSKHRAENQEDFHVTSFYGRPEEPVKDLFLKADAGIRNIVRKVAKKGLWKQSTFLIRR